jgi:hypothetical protein
MFLFHFQLLTIVSTLICSFTTISTYVTMWVLNYLTPTMTQDPRSKDLSFALHFPFS